MKAFSVLFLSLFFFVPSQAQWNQIPGDGRAIRITSDASNGKLWVLGTNKGIYYYSSNGWSEYPGGGRGFDICVHQNTPYVIGLDHQIWYGTGSGWEVLSGGGKGKRIDVDASNGRLVLIGMDDAIYYYHRGAWTQFAGGGRGIDVCSYRGTPYVIGLDKAIYKLTGSVWTKLPGGGLAHNIAVEANNGRLIVTGTNSAIYYFNGNGWTEYSGGGRAHDLCSINSQLYVVGMDNAIYTYGTSNNNQVGNTTVGTGSLQELPGGGRAIKITTDASNGKVWVLGLNKGIHHHNGTAWVEYPGGGRGYDLCVYKNTPYVIGLDNKIYKGTGSGWEQVPSTGTFKGISVDARNGKLWLVGKDEKIYSLN